MYCIMYWKILVLEHYFVNVYDEEFEPGETKLKELLQEYALRIEGLL